MQPRHKDLDLNYRLSPAALNALVRNVALSYNPTIPADTVEAYLPVIHKETNRKFYLCPMSRDSQSNHSENRIPYFWKTIAKFLRENSDRNCTLLVPIVLCRNFGKAYPAIAPKFLQRAHAVLLEVNLQTQVLNIHDSQGFLKWAVYPDKIMETIDKVNMKLNSDFKYHPVKNYHCYSRQETSYDCGYFVYTYIQNFFLYGNSNHFKDIKVAIARRYSCKEEFILHKLGPDEAAHYISLPEEGKVEEKQKEKEKLEVDELEAEFEENKKPSADLEADFEEIENIPVFKK